MRKSRFEVAYSYIFGVVMRANPAFDPRIVAEALDEAIGRLVGC